MTETKDRSHHRLSLVRTIEAPREQVFDAWLDPETLKLFMKPAPGVEVARAEVDPTDGGEFLILMRLGERDMPHAGRYRRIQRPERLEFTWISTSAGNDSHVVLDFEALGPSRTRLTLRHEGLPTKQAREDHEQGWSAIIRHLEPAARISQSPPGT